VGAIIPDAEVMPDDVDVPEVVGEEDGLFVWENSVFWLLVKTGSLLVVPSGVFCVFLMLIRPSSALPVIFLSSFKSIPLAPKNPAIMGLLRNFSALCRFCSIKALVSGGRLSRVFTSGLFGLFGSVIVFGRVNNRAFFTLTAWGLPSISILCYNNLMSETLKTKLVTDVDHQAVLWHSFTDADVMAKLMTSTHGLKADQVAERLAEFGSNSLPAKKPPSLLKIFVHQFFSPLIYILLVAAVVSVAIGDVKDAAFIGLVILLNAALGTYQEFKAEKSAHALQNLLKTMAHVRRNGHEEEIDAVGIVPGDVVLLESGAKVPADMRILSSRNLQVDESLLTGESMSVEKFSEAVVAEASVTERKNMVFAGTTVMGGRCVAVVAATGMHTQIGLIAASIVTTKTAKPPLIIRMEKFSANISYLVMGACMLLAIVAVFRGISPTDTFFLAVALAVSAIPEGLPVAMTVALSIATSRMAKRNVIVRKLAAVESLGSCTCIASDKTGTLTVNRQTIRTVWLSSHKRFDITGEGYNANGEVIALEGGAVSSDNIDKLKRLAEASVLCNEGDLFKRNNEWEHQGDAVDVAFLAYAQKLKLNPEKVRSSVNVIADIPYESELRFAAKFYSKDGQRGVAVKGAMETVLPFCSHMLSHKGRVKINPKEIEKVALAMAEEGYRVIAVADGNLTETRAKAVAGKKSPGADDLPKMTFLGLVGLIDPLRTEAKDAIGTCHLAGVRVIMVTGDHPETAFAIGRDLGIAENKNEVVTGNELQEMGDSEVPEFLEAVKNGKIFARVTPVQKLQIVEALIKLGHFVAVTGDGVNDAPALKKANVGVAMGSGTDIAKDTASIIVTDDNFVSIVAGIEEGRHAYANVRKVIYLLISTGAAEITLFLLALLVGLPLPLLAVQLLWLNLVTNGIQDVALAFEGGEKGVMDRPPRRPNEGIFNGQMLSQTAVSGVTMGVMAFVLWYFLMGGGYEETVGRSMLLLFMVLMENFHVFNCRSETKSAFRVSIKNNPVLIFGVLAAQGIHIASMHIPFMQDVLKVSPGTWSEWLVFAVAASLILAVMEIFKLLFGKRFANGTTGMKPAVEKA